jgi:hypothetical protein
VSCTIRQVLDARCAVSPSTVERPWRRFRVSEREREFLFVCFWASKEFLIICLWYVSLVFSLWVKSGFCIVCLASAQRKEKEKNIVEYLGRVINRRGLDWVFVGCLYSSIRSPVHK